MSNLTIAVEGLEVLAEAMSSLDDEISNLMAMAGKEAADVILDTEGLRNYPAAGAGNQPPAPFYVRGKGTESLSGNDGKSERLGTQFYMESEGLTTRVGNRASYAEFVIGENQAGRLGAIGWKRLIDVGQNKAEDIAAIFQGWIDKAIHDNNLQP